MQAAQGDPLSGVDQPAHTLDPVAIMDPLESTGQNKETTGSDTATMAYGAVPFELAAGTDKWWYIDSSDSAYWTVIFG